ncbi:MAG: hypothetical protein ACRDOH_05495 [Streptosporangiaceae bacterium]
MVDISVRTGPAGPSLTRSLADRAGTRSSRIVATAARWIYDGRRLDMQGLAAVFVIVAQVGVELVR